MAATGIGNSAGRVALTDGGAPRIMSALARASVISGGVFVFGSTADDVVSSGLNSFVTADLLVAKDASGLQFNGIAIATAGSNEPIGVMTEGMIILVANSTILGGQKVGCDGENSVFNVAANVGSMTNGLEIGRAWTNATSGNHCIVEIGR